MSKKIYISVCKNVILANLKHGSNRPPVRVSRGKHDKHPQRALIFETYGRIRVVGDMRLKPMPWGARVWVEIEELPEPTKPKGRPVSVGDSWQNDPHNYAI